MKIAITGHRALSEQVERYVDAGICSEPVTYDQAKSSASHALPTAPIRSSPTSSPTANGFINPRR